MTLKITTIPIHHRHRRRIRVTKPSAAVAKAEKGKTA